MNDRQIRLLTILSAVLLVLVAVLVLVKPPETDDNEEGAKFSPAFGEAVDASTVTGIDLESAAGTVHLARVDGVWRLTAPFEGLAEERKVEDLVRTLTELEVGKPLDGADGDLASFGLDAPIVARLERGD